MNNPIRILYIDDSPFDRELVQDALAKEHDGFELVTTATHASFKAALAQGGFDIVLSDFNILGFDGLQVLEVVHSQDANLPVVIVTGTGSEEIAVEALKRGASEYVIKTPAHIQRLPQTVQAVLRKKQLQEENKRAEESLRASEKMLREAQLIAGLGSYDLDVVSGLWKSSDVLDEIFGIDENYARSVEGWAALIHPDDRQRMVDYFANEILGRHSRFDDEYRIIRQSDKAERWVHGLGELEYDPQGHVYKLYGTIQDITERKQAESALAYHSSLIENVSDAIISTDLDFTIRTWNRAAEIIYGWLAADVVGKLFPDVVPTDYPDNDREQVLQEFRTRGFWKGEVVQKRRDGTKLNIFSSASFIRDSAGNPTGTVVVNHDITERKRAEAAQRESEAQLEFALRMSQTGGWYLDLTDRTAHRTLEHDRIFGYESLLPEWTYEMFLEHIVPEDRPRVDMLFGAAIAAQSDWNFECRIRRVSGDIRWIRAVGRIQHDGERHLPRMAGIVQDITERKWAEEALRKSEAELRALFASMQDTVLVIDRDGVYRNIAPTNPASWHISPQAVIGRRLEELFSAEQSRIFHGVIQQVLDTKQTVQIEYQMAVNSYALWYAANISPMDADNTLWVARDITERKRAEEALHQRFVELEALHTVSTSLRTAQSQEEALVLLLGHTLTALNTDAGAIWFFDPGKNQLYPVVERGWFQNMGKFPLKPGEGIGGGVFGSGKIHVTTEFRSDPMSRAATREQAPSGWGGVCLPIRAGDMTVGVMFVALPPLRQITTEQVKLLESLAEMTAVTLHRLHLLLEAQEQARRVQGIMDATPMGILLLNRGGQILLANPVAEDYLLALTGQGVNLPLRHLGNRQWEELLSPLAAQEGWQGVQVGACTFEMITRPLSDKPDADLWVLVLNDVTREREQQHYQQAQERLATVGQLAAGIAHDFNNIMGIIVLHVSLLHKTPGLTEKQQRQLETINNQAQLAANLIRQILDFSRRSVLEKTAIDILPLVKEMVKLLERTLPESIHLKLEYDRSEYVINGDPTRLQQALMNLAVNARDAMPGGGELTFTCRSLKIDGEDARPLPDMGAGEWLCLAVSDTGSGIAPEHLVHIFEPFFTTKSPGQGSGLGLSQVYGIVKQHGGGIHVESQVGRGSRFLIYLPALLEAGTVAPVVKKGLVTGGGEKILVVEDNQAMRMALVETLESLNYQVRQAGHGKEALAMLQTTGGEIDLVLSDLVMPEMGGEKLLSAMREQGMTQPMIVLSGHPLTSEMRSMQALGLAGWLIKPPNMEDLSMLLARTLRQ